MTAEEESVHYMSYIWVLSDRGSTKPKLMSAYKTGIWMRCAWQRCLPCRVNLLCKVVFYTED